MEALKAKRTSLICRIFALLLEINLELLIAVTKLLSDTNNDNLEMRNRNKRTRLIYERG